MSISQVSKTLGTGNKTTGSEVRIVIGTNIAGDVVTSSNVDTVSTDKIIGTVGTRTGGASKTLELSAASSGKLLDDTGALLDGWKDNVNKPDIITIEGVGNKGLNEYPNGLTGDVLSVSGSGASSKITLVNLSDKFGKAIDPVAFAAQQCTISLERFTPAGEFSSEVSSGLTITQSRSPIVEKPPLSLVDGITSLGSACLLYTSPSPRDS